MFNDKIEKQLSGVQQKATRQQVLYVGKVASKCFNFCSSKTVGGAGGNVVCAAYANQLTVNCSR
jgi:hypothetical protein